jgi:hypothetical protein
MSYRKFATLAAVGLVAAVTAVGVARGMLSLTPRAPQWADWATLVAAVAAAEICLPECGTRSLAPALYVLGLTAIGMSQLAGDFAPGRFFLWVGVCEWSGFVLVAAVIGWGWQRLQAAAARNRESKGRWSRFVRHVFNAPGTLEACPNEPTRRPTSAGSGGACPPACAWFCRAQVALAGATAVLATWTAIDSSFDGLGEGLALFGWSGRRAGVPAALMLLGAAIVMAWQTSGVWRARWQFAALAAGVLFSSSFGWSRVDAAGAAPWLQRSFTLLLSASMMTLLTSFGLARVLPGQTDWIVRARRAAPFFGGLSVLLLVLVLVQQWLWPG